VALEILEKPPIRAPDLDGASILDREKIVGRAERGRVRIVAGGGAEHVSVGIHQRERLVAVSRSDHIENRVCRQSGLNGAVALRPTLLEGSSLA
jgi:hypothetical protein